MGLFKSKTSFIPRKNRNGTTTAGQYSQYGISQSSNGGTSSQKEDLSDIYKRLDEKLDSNKVGTANGAASLDENGKVPTDQLPSYVDDVVEYETLQDFPSPGETGKIYISTSTNKTYRWSGSQYIDISSASDDCLLKSSKISDNEIGTIVAGGDVTSADNYLNNRGLKSLWAYITAAANDIVANLSTMIAAKQDAISVTTKSDTPTGNDTVIMQANGTNNTKTFLRRKLSDVWNFFKTQEYPEAYLGWGGKHISGSFAPVDAALVDVLGANRTAIYPANCIDILYSRDKGNTWIDYGASDSIKRRLFSTGVSSNDIVIGKSTSEEMADENSMLRIIFKSRADGSSSNVLYAQLKKFAIYVSTNGSNGVKCTVDALRADRYDSGEDNWTIFANEAPISGWSGWNIINLGSTLTTAGNDSQKTGQYRYVRFTFSNTSRTGTSKGLSILRIYSYGLNCWNAPNSLATRGTLYNYDDTQNAIFPAKIYAQNSTNNEVYYKGGTDVSVEDGGTGASTAIGAEYNILNQVQDTDVAIDDNRKIALCNQTKSSTAGVFRWLKMSNVWTYIKGKIDSAYSSVLGSGITSSKVSSYDTHIADGTKHTTSAEKATWNGKADAVHTHTKGQVGLGNVDNTSDADKPVSTAQQAVFDAMQSDIDDKAEYAGEPTITKGTFTLYPCGEMEAETSYTLPSGLLYSLKSFLSAVLKYASYGSIELKVGSNSMRGVLSLVRGNNTVNIESHPNQTTTNVTCTLPKDGGALLTEANLPTSLKNPYKLKINGQEYDGSSEKEIPVDSNPTQNSTALVKSGGVYAALNGKADSSELSNYYLKTDTVDKAKKATNATYAEEADSATYDIAGDQINLTYLKKSGGVMSGDLKMSDASIRTTKLQDGDKMLEYSELTKSSTQPYTGRNLIGAHGGSGANVQTIIRSGGDLIHRRGNDSTKNDTTILDTSNVGRLLYKGPSLLGYIRNSTDNRGKSRPFFSVDVKEIIGSTDVVLCFIVERMAVGSTSRSSTQTLKIQIRRGSNGLLQTMYRSRKVDFGVDIKMYSYLDDATNKLYVYIDVEDNYTNTFLYPHHFASHLGTERFDIYVGFDNGGSSFSPSEIPIS